jgi:hypothetical protein
MTDMPERIWACREGFQWKADFWSPSKTISSTEYVRADLVTAERDHILAILDAHPNAAPGWLALQIREGKL